MGKIYKVVAGKPGQEVKTFQEALALSEGQEMVIIPPAALCLSVEGGKIEAVKEGKDV
jgi:hypothetical protein